MICNFVHFYLQHMLHKNTDWFGWSMKFTLHVNFCSEGTSCKPSKITTICCEFVNYKIKNITSFIFKSGGTKTFRLLAAKVGDFIFFIHVLFTIMAGTPLNSIDVLHRSIGAIIYSCVWPALQQKAISAIGTGNVVLSEIATTPINGDDGWKKQRRRFQPYNIENSTSNQ